MKRKDLVNTNDIWNAMITIIGEHGYSTENKVLHKTFIVFQYYSELESGGHEILFTWFSEYIEKVGITHYLQELIDILEKIGAHEYALIEQNYGEEMWRKFVALENGEIEENKFYRVIEKADTEYNKLNGKLGELLENYFIRIHTDLIEIVED